MTTVELAAVRVEDKPVLANLLQLYCYDFSAVRGFDVTEHGVFTYPYLDHYFVEPERDAFFVRHDGALAGFALARELPSGERDVSEFFVMRRHRRLGVGARAAAQLLAMHPGRWTVRFDVANVDAAAFWPGVVDAAAAGEVQRDEEPSPTGYPQTTLRFSVG